MKTILDQLFKDALNESISVKAMKSARVNDLAFRNEGYGWVKWILSSRHILTGKLTKLDEKLARQFSKRISVLAGRTIRPVRSFTTELVVDDADTRRKACRRALKKLRILKSKGYDVPLTGFIVPLSLFDQDLRRSQSPVGLVKYLKASVTLLQQSVGGMRHPDTRDLGARVSRTKSGLPRVIPSRARVLIRSYRKREIQHWLSVLSLYRVLSMPGKVNLSTITEGSGLPDLLPYGDVEKFVGPFFDRLSKASGKFIPVFGKVLERARVMEQFGFIKPFIVPTAGPIKGGTWNSSYVSLAVGLTAYWESSEGIQAYHHLVEWYRIFGGGNDFFSRFGSSLLNSIPRGAAFIPDYDGMRSSWPAHLAFRGPSDLPFVDLRALVVSNIKERARNLGKLAFLDEPAGKVRVIAMVTAWLQWAMRPLHDRIFDILRGIPQDGTFDQPRAILVFRNYLKNNRLRSVWSYDLSAATDCLPIRLQQEIIRYWIGPDVSDLWRELLVGHGYWAHSLKYLPEGKYVRYGTGQPMGALSSWAMLALTHHFIVQLAADRVGILGWFRAYCVLGDDIEIGHPEVAAEYVAIMRSLGVKIGLAKSVISHNGHGEFAKKYWSVKRGLMPMVSFKELIVAKCDGSVLVNLIRKFNCPLQSLLFLRGKKRFAMSKLQGGYKKQPRWLRGLLVTYSSAKGPGAVPMKEWLTSKSLLGRSHMCSVKYFREDVINAAIRLYNSIIDLRNQVYAVPEYSTQLRDDWKADVQPALGRPGMGVLEPDLAPVPTRPYSPRDTHLYAQNDFSKIIFQWVFEPVAIERRHSLAQALRQVACILSDISKMVNPDIDFLVKQVVRIREVRAEAFKGRSDPAWQLRDETAEKDKMEFLSMLRFYNSFESARTRVKYKTTFTLQLPLEVGQILGPLDVHLPFALGQTSPSHQPKVTAMKVIPVKDVPPVVVAPLSADALMAQLLAGAGFEKFTQQ